MGEYIDRQPKAERQHEQNHAAPVGVEQREWVRPWMPAFLEALARLPNVSAACRTAGVGRTTVFEFERRDPVFAEAMRQAKETGLDLLEQIVHRRATVGEPRVLTRRRTRRGPAGGVIEEEITIIEEVEVSNALLMRLLEAYRPERWSCRTSPCWSRERRSDAARWLSG